MNDDLNSSTEHALEAHLSAEELEAHAMGHTRGIAKLCIERHIAVCELCREELGRQASWVQAVRAALASQTWAETRASPTGVVSLSVTRIGPRAWLARVAGSELCRENLFASEYEGRAWCEETFRTDFEGVE
jgi:hypothetical protein